MLRNPTLFGPDATIGQVRDFLGGEHVHAALITEDGRQLSVVEPVDLTGSEPAENAPALMVGRLHGRVVRPDADLFTTWEAMRMRARRRLAVVDEQGDLLGLLCLKRSGHGFCSEADVRARSEDRRRDPGA
jgi:CBS domain-containing protein